MHDDSSDDDYSLPRFQEEKRDFENHIDNLSHAPLDSLLDLYHYPDLHLPKCLPERYVHGIDLLNALACYNDIVSLHYACGQCAKDGIVPLVTLLDEGADVNVCNDRGSTAFECFAKCERRTNRVNEIVRHLFKHVHKLKAAGMHVHPQNQRQYEIVRSREDMRHFVDQQTKIDYEEELRRMEKHRLKNDRLTLRDLLRDDVELTLATMARARKAIREHSFDVKYPRLGCLVKMRYRQVVAREEWKPLASDALRMLAGRGLPRNCVEGILRGLRNYDVANLLAMAFNVCLRRYGSERKERRKESRLAVIRSPRKTMPRI